MLLCPDKCSVPTSALQLNMPLALTLHSFTHYRRYLQTRWSLGGAPGQAGLLCRRLEGLGFLGDFYCTAALQEGFLNWILSCQDWILQGVHSPKFLLRGIQQMAAPRCFASRLSGAQQGPSPEDLHLLRDEQRSDRARSSPLPEEQRLQQERLAAAGALPRPKAESRSGPKLVLP